MKCYNHQTADAAAVCCSCGRALCHDCATEVAGKVACLHRCEADVAERNALHARFSRMYLIHSRPSTGLRVGVLMAIMGVLYAAGSFLFLRNVYVYPTLLGTGILFTILGLIKISQSRRK